MRWQADFYDFWFKIVFIYQIIYSCVIQWKIHDWRFNVVLFNTQLERIKGKPFTKNICLKLNIIVSVKFEPV